MALGLVLHAMLSFMPGIWPVRDARQSDTYYLFFAAIHGFRMPLFFLLSGFFTAMLWRRRGLGALLRQRAMRILLPLVIGMFTVVPAVSIVSVLAMRGGADEVRTDGNEGEQAPVTDATSDLWTAISGDDIESVRRLLDEGADVNGPHPSQGHRPLVHVLMAFPLFHHLWFLWFLCWLVPAFAIGVKVARALKWKSPPSWLALSPARLLWLLPLTMAPQWFMGGQIEVFGPDTSLGLIPIPHVLAYYAIFFGFGALYYEAGDDAGRLGAWWRITLPVMLLLLLPLGLEVTHDISGERDSWLPARWHKLAVGVLQVTYAWVMSFALMGLCRSLLVGESSRVRYLSDASYWLYLMHVPLVIAAQWAVRPWPVPSLLKFALINLVVGGFLLFTYQHMVRYTWIGTLLNGRRQRPPKT